MSKCCIIFFLYKNISCKQILQGVKKTCYGLGCDLLTSMSHGWDKELKNFVVTISGKEKDIHGWNFVLDG